MWFVSLKEVLLFFQSQKRLFKKSKMFMSESTMQHVNGDGEEGVLEEYEYSIFLVQNGTEECYVVKEIHLVQYLLYQSNVTVVG